MREDWMSARKRLVLTFDAFGTLFTPKSLPGHQYAVVAQQHGLLGLAEEELQANFRKAYKIAQREYPNYGKATGMGATRWWSNVIESTFAPIIRPASLPAGVVPDLLNRFSTSEGNRLYPDVPGFFRKLHHQRISAHAHPATPIDTVIGIITNSDDRVPLILESHNLHCTPRRFTSGMEQDLLIRRPFDIFDFIALSYDVGVGKPDRGIFDAAKSLAGVPNAEEGVEHIYLHVGNDAISDYQGAEKAGWRGALLGGHGRILTQKPNDGNVLFFDSLRPLNKYIWNDVLGLDPGALSKQYVQRNRLNLA